VLFILYRLVDPPGGGDVAGVSIDISPTVGAFLGLLAAVGITYGGYRAMQEEGASFGDIGDQLSNRGGGPGAPGGGHPTQSAGQTPPPPPSAQTPPPPPGPGQGGPPAQ
jgi:hypothetical protein